MSRAVQVAWLRARAVEVVPPAIIADPLSEWIVSGITPSNPAMHASMNSSTYSSLGPGTERAAGIRFAKDALGQGQQLAAAQLDRPATRQRCRPVRVRVQVVGSGKLVLQQRAIPHRHEHECRHIGQQ